MRENIARFGGDPARVTLCGQSAGAGSIAALLAMPLAAGLSRRAIAQTVPGTYCTPALAADIAAVLAARLGTVPAAAGLAAIDSQRLVGEISLLMRRHARAGRSMGRLAYAGARLLTGSGRRDTA